MASNRSLYLGLGVLLLGCLTMALSPQRFFGGVIAFAGLALILWKA